jgi:hypothetical protein
MRWKRHGLGAEVDHAGEAGLAGEGEHLLAEGGPTGVVTTAALTIDPGQRAA